MCKAAPRCNHKESIIEDRRPDRLFHGKCHCGATSSICYWPDTCTERLMDWPRSLGQFCSDHAAKGKEKILADFHTTHCHPGVLRYRLPIKVLR